MKNVACPTRLKVATHSRQFNAAKAKIGIQTKG